MELEHAKETAIDFMKDFGLIEKGWRFIFSNKKRAFGTCYYRRKEIALSKYLVPFMSYKDVKDTILHEIAHAIDAQQRGYSNHDKKWKMIAKRVGADPMASHDKADIPISAFNYYHECPVCGQKYGVYKRPRARYLCGECREPMEVKKVDKGL